jgi:hypothetical protein
LQSPDISFRKLETLTGISRSQLQRDATDGMPRHSAEACLAWRRAHRDVAHSVDGRIDLVQTAATKLITPPAHAQLAPGAVDALSAPAAAAGQSEKPPPPDSEEVDEHALAYRQDRARNERIKADRADIELGQLRGQLVSLREVEELEFTAGRILRDRMEMVSPRFAAELQALILAQVPDEHRAEVAKGVQIHIVERKLADTVRAALSEAAKAIEDARRDDDDNTD